MACLRIPKIAFPPLSGGFGFGITTPDISLDPTLCCKILPFPIGIPPVSLGALIPIPPAVLAAIAAAEAYILALVDLYAIDCPIDGPIL